MGGENLRFFRILLIHYYGIIIMSVVLKFKRKRISTHDLTPYLIFRGFDQKILILDKSPIPKWP